VLTNAEVLAVEISVPGGKAAVIVDTGAYQGVELCPDRWREWRAMHAKQPITLNAFYFLPVGQVVKEEGWASVLSLGPMIFNDVPVMEMPATNAPVGPIPNEAILGLAALKRLEVIVDVGNGVAYVRPKNTVPSPYDHNRLGAVFVPRDLRSSDLVARVAEDSPAWKAGVRDGDLLLKVDGSAATTWRADPAVLELVQFWQRPAGSEFKLTLKRGRKTFDARVVLRDILSPDGK
jgi:membrane-associated protease RseP (regulator of RpoE activity)